MKHLVRLLLLVAITALGYWLWTEFFPNPEAVIRMRLDKVAKIISFSGKEGNISKIASIQQLAGYFAANVEISVDTPAQAKQTFSGREEVTQAALGIRSMLSGLSVEFLDQTVTLNATKTEATVNLTGKARVAGDRDIFIQELKFYLQKIDGDWLIVRVESVRTLN